jgi:subfamily B ATP-binding cassette protein MsbA
VQQGARSWSASLLTLVKDSLTLLALLGYLLWLNWQLTLFVGLLFPTVACDAHHGPAAAQAGGEGQAPPTSLAYVVEENVLAWRIVRLHGAAPAQARRFADSTTRALRRLLLKSAVSRRHDDADDAAAGRLCAVGRHRGGAVAGSGSGGSTVGGFVAFITAMLMLVAADQAPVGRDGAHHTRPGGGRTRRGPDRAPAPSRQGGSTPRPARGEIDLTSKRDVGCAIATTPSPRSSR